MDLPGLGSVKGVKPERAILHLEIEAGLEAPVNIVSVLVATVSSGVPGGDDLIDHDHSLSRMTKGQPFLSSCRMVMV